MCVDGYATNCEHEERDTAEAHTPVHLVDEEIFLLEEWEENVEERRLRRAAEAVHNPHQSVQKTAANLRTSLVLKIPIPRDRGERGREREGEREEEKGRKRKRERKRNKVSGTRQKIFFLH